MVKECRYFTWTQFEHPSFSLLAFYWPYNLADKNIFLKRLQENLMQTMRKIWIISRILTLNDRSGLNTCNSSCPVKLSNFLCLIAWASRGTLDLLTGHFKEQKQTCIVHGSLRFFKDIIHWAGGFNTDKKRYFEKYIMTHHGISISKIQRNGNNVVRYIDLSDGSGSLGSLNTCIA